MHKLTDCLQLFVLFRHPLPLSWFMKDEETNVESFAQGLASIADAYINDAFGTAHRAHASVAGVPALLPKERCGVGCLIASEVAYLDFSQLGEGDKVAASKWL
jgi:3-phosphoglycerate kinase